MSARLLRTMSDLCDTESADDLMLGTAAVLSSEIACDDVLWAELLPGDPSTRVRRGDLLDVDQTLSQSLARPGAELPAVRGLLKSPGDRTPRRVSDVVGERKSLASRPYWEVFRLYRARYQLSLVTRLNAGFGAGWVLLRSSSDFSDADVEVALFLLPVLVALDRLARAKFRVTGPAELVTAALTPREVDVLRLVGQGLTARTIGRVHGISESTVRKHLEHTYEKLGRHDRLTAVVRARELGILT